MVQTQPLKELRNICAEMSILLPKTLAFVAFIMYVSSTTIFAMDYMLYNLQKCVLYNHFANLYTEIFSILQCSEKLTDIGVSGT